MPLSESYAQAGWLSYLSFSWLNPLMMVGTGRQVELADTPELVNEEDTWRRTRELVGLLHEEARKDNSHPILRALMRAYWPNLLLFQLFGIVQHFLSLVAPLLLKQILVFQEAQQAHEKEGLHSAAIFGAAALSQEQVRTGLLAVVGSIFLGLFCMIAGSQIEFYKARLSIRMGQALRGAVLTRSVQGELPSLARGSNTESSGKAAPSIYNVISFDVQPNIDIVFTILSVWLFPYQFITTMAVLFSQVEWAVLPGLAVIIVAEIICGVLLYYDGHFRDALLVAKDNRLGRCDEAFESIRTLQMLSWTEPFEQQVIAARNEELRVKNLRLWLTKMVMALSYVLSAMVTLVTLGYFVIYYSDGALKASVAVPVIGLVTGLIGPIGQFPNWLNQYLVWRSAYGRVSQYMGLSQRPEHPASGEGAISLEGDCLEVCSGELEGQMNRTSTAVAGFKGCTLRWGQESAPSKDAICDADWGWSTEEGHEPGAEHDVESGAGLGIGSPLLGDNAADATLKGLDLEVRSGELLALVGCEGQGKTSALTALLGEMTVVSGAVFSPAIARWASEANGPLPLPQTAQAGRDLLKAESDGDGFAGSQQNAIAYAPQEPAIYTGSLRWNILFGCRNDAHLYQQVLSACQLDIDIETMPLGDLSEVSHGGATLSGGQKARISLARAVYRAALDLKDHMGQGPMPLALFDEPFCALDRGVAREIVRSLFQQPDGLLVKSAVVVATSDPWWLSELGGGNDNIHVAVMRNGSLATTGAIKEMRGFQREFPELQPAFSALEPRANRLSGSYKNPQEDSEGIETDSNDADASSNLDGYFQRPQKILSHLPVKSQVEPSKTIAVTGKLLQEERREKGHVKSATYTAYFGVIGHYTLGSLLVALSGIMFFQECTTLWIAYWSADDREGHFLQPYVLKVFGKVPSGNAWLLWVYVGLLAVFTVSTFAGHALEIVGGIRAARQLFKDALLGTFARPFRWWDSNPTGRVLNRFSEDVEVMDNAITNIIGVIIGAVLYFVGHVTILAIANKHSLILLPLIAFFFEGIARYYRKTVREVHRLYLVSMSTVYQGMVEAIVGKTTVRAFAASEQVVCQNLDGLDVFMRLVFTKASISAWVGLRMGLVGYSLSVATTLHPVLQYFGLIAPQSAALVGFAIAYSAGISAIIQQFIMNWSDLEMQFVSIERLQEYARGGESVEVQAASLQRLADRPTTGLKLCSVSVTYREGLRPALMDVSVAFAPGESCAIVGRTGAGKSSLLLAILQLVPYTGQITVDGQVLSALNAKNVRQNLVGVVPQQPMIFSGSVRWNLDPTGEKSSMELWRVLESVGLRKVILADSRGLEATLGKVPGEKALTLSQGQKQLLCAARALLRQPRVVMLDEVSACLPDGVAQTVMTDLIERFTENQASVLVVTHQADIAAICDRTITVAAGRIVPSNS